MRRALVASAADVLKLLFWGWAGNDETMGRVCGHTGSNMDLITLRPVSSVRVCGPDDDEIGSAEGSDRSGEIGDSGNSDGRDDSGDRGDNGRRGGNGGKGEIKHSLSVTSGTGMGEDDSVRSIVTRFSWGRTTGLACSCP